MDNVQSKQFSGNLNMHLKKLTVLQK